MTGVGESVGQRAARERPHHVFPGKDAYTLRMWQGVLLLPDVQQG